MSRRKLALVALVSLAFVLAASIPSYPQSNVFFFGKVVDESGAPVGLAEITVYKGNSIVTFTRTSPDGSFNLYVPVGSYTFLVYKKGYAPIYMTLEVTPEKGGSLGVLVLKKGVTVVPDVTSVYTSQGDTVRIPVKVFNKCLDPVLVSFSIEVPQGWRAYFVGPNNLVASDFYIEAGSNRSLVFVVEVPLNASEKESVRVSFTWFNLSGHVDFTFTVRQREWRLLELPTTSVKSFPGGQLSIPINVSTPFSYEATVTLSVFAPSNFIASLVDENGLTVQSVTVRPGEKRRLQLVIYVPPTARISTYSLRVVARSGPLQSIVNLDVIVESAYDLLKISPGATSINVTSGSTVTFRVALKNEGNMPTVALLRVQTSSPLLRAYTSVSGEPVASLYLVPGEEKALALIVEVDPSTPSGIYLVSLRANGTTSTAEQSFLVRVTGTRKIVISNIIFQVTGAPGMTTTYKLGLVNAGNTPLNNVMVQVEAPSGGFEVTVHPSTLALPPNSTASVDISILIPSNASEGFYNLPIHVVAGDIRLDRVLVLEVRGEQGLGFTYIATGLFLLSLTVVSYSKRQRRARG
ncbi:NEW3 domain-containing protein [Thermofilum pendens]|uniref:Membrane protein-like protein n=1 Tax=Thermofilum pendens (strain DSM 2475 / Hrk 5) TaxID=368408 RepID=A1RWG2_THEPD|nr:NEW3 domain-containing protein [Thermofilum pendens]ABL77542.1 membrane protein-like protein [Thermofilum pendens Hrk 5]